MSPSELSSVLDGAYSQWQSSLEIWPCIQALGAKLSKDGNQWCFLWGENIQEGVAGFGDTIREAAFDFYNNVCSEIIR